MPEDILINVTPQETRVAVMANGVVQELQVERTASRGLVGNIYMGRVVRVLPGMQSAFIEIGLERAAFLHVADIWEARANIGLDLGLFVMFLYLPLHLLTFYIQRPESRTRLGVVIALLQIGRAHV